MKLLLPPLCLLLLAGAPTDELAFAPAEGTVLARVFEARAEYHLTDLSASVNGEVIERDAELPEDSSSFLEHIAVTDTLGPVEDGRPREVLRHFDELRQENGGAEESTLVSALEGRTVRFSWDEDEARYTARSGDDEELDEERAAWLAEDMDLRLVLPGKEVEAGDEWPLDAKLYLALMWPSGLLDFGPEGEETADDEHEFSRETIERLEGSGTARLEEFRDEDGTRVAVLHVELEITTSSDSVLPAEESEELSRPELALEVELERSLSGTILWDVEHGHALSAEFECEASRLQTRSWTLSGEDEDGSEVELDIEQSLLYEGTIRYTVSIERK